jgi:hypothetical protein
MMVILPVGSGDLSTRTHKGTHRSYATRDLKINFSAWI